MDEETEKKFDYILTSEGKRGGWHKIPTYKSVMIKAINMLYEKEKVANEKD